MDELTAADWSALRRQADELPSEQRRALTELWLGDARLEHASIASFSRFSLELLAVAAPPQLVAEAHQAALEELGHAALCFSIASAYHGAPLGPGPLPIDRRAFERFDLPTAVRQTMIEGCLGETLAALEAQAAAELAEPVAVKATLTRIAREESRHAALAYRFIGWARGKKDPQVEEAIREASAEGLAPPSRDEATEEPGPAWLGVHGRLSAKQRAEVRARGLREVVRPALEAVLR